MTGMGLLQGEDASLEQILQRREARAARQRELLTRGGGCLVSFTMNIPGVRKQFPLAAMGFQEGWAVLKAIFAPETVLARERFSGVTGEEGMLLLTLSPVEVKRRIVALEEGHPLGRLWDMDVLDPEGGQVGRSELGMPPRKCLLCGSPAKACARSRRHTVEDVFYCAAQRLEAFFQEKTAKSVGACAVRALVMEVSVTPKPGLVDRSNSGAHKDMDFFTFVDSTAALAPWFQSFFQIGWTLQDKDAKTLFEQLRQAGKRAEADMFRATNGVNTHKGLVFSLAILCGALGRLFAAQGTPPARAALGKHCGEIGACALEDLSRGGEDTNGMRCFRAFHIAGIRGEAASGFHSVFRFGLPILEERLARGWNRNEAAIATLLSLISEVEDTNMIRRGGVAEAERRRVQARSLREEQDPLRLRELVGALDKDYIQHNLSPGGCADLLAVTLMIRNLEEEGLVVTQ